MEDAADAAADDSTAPGADRDLAVLEALEQDLAGLEGELDRVERTETSDLEKGAPGQGAPGQGDSGSGPDSSA